MPRILLVLLLLVASSLLRAAGEPVPADPIRGEFVPGDLYRYQSVVLPNGFRAVLNPRRQSRNVSFRLVVDVGLLDFDCRDRELPHLAEHLMFGGYGDLTETDLDAEVNALGGEWNAYTHPYRTEYQLDIYSGNALAGLDILYRMFTETAVTDDRLDSARGVVHAESGGEPGFVRDYLHEWGIGDGAVEDSYRRYVPASRAFCARVPTTDHIGVADVEAFLREHYQPGAMLLIAVGDFDPVAMRAALEGSFGALPAGPVSPPARPKPALQPRALEYHSMLNPLLGNTTQVTIDLFVGAPAALSDERFALQQLADYLDARLYEEVRVKRGLAYTPTAALVDQGDFMTLLLDAEVDPARADEVLGIMAGLVDELRDAGIDAETLEAQRQGALYGMAASLDQNASFSDIYAAVSDRLARGEPVPDIEGAIDAYDAKALSALAGRYLAMDRALVFVAAPTLTYRALGWVLALLTLIMAFGAGRVLARRRARRTSAPRDSRLQRLAT